MIETARLQLRRPRVSDKAALLELDNDPEVMRWINGGETVDNETFEAQILPVYLAGTDQRNYGFWIIELDNNFAGWVSLRLNTGIADVASLGYRISRSHWGLGIAPEAATALIARAFQEEQLTEILATTYEENVGSIRVMEKLGMQFRRRFRIDDEDTVSDTSISDGEIWPGEDVEYVISRPPEKTAASS